MPSPALLLPKQSAAKCVRVARAKASARSSGVVLVRAAQREASTDAHALSRRASLVSLAGAAALLTGASATTGPALAAYGDAANVFGRTTNKTGFVPFVGNGFALTLPSKWNPSKEEDVPGTILRYEDNYYPVNNFVVAAVPTDKQSIDAFGAPADFLPNVAFVLGKQAFAGETKSEGGFAPDRVSAASILDIGSTTDKKGKVYYTYELLSRTADGTEGGRHQLIKATVADGKLWLLLVRAGDKRWFKNVKKEAFTVFDSFNVA